MQLGNLNVIFLFVINSIITSTKACGITTHIEIAHRATTNYDHVLDNKINISSLIKTYQSAFQAGNPYPDSFYPSICKNGVLNSVSEDTHWVPFLNATINYIRNTYKKPYNEDALRLIVFTLGFASHQDADVTWHSLDVEQGFLSAMGFVNFHGSFNKAHGVGDFGGDVLNQYELELSYISDLTEWYVPYDDLYNIYLQFYGKEMITKMDIIECSSLMYLGRLGEKLAISLLYRDYFAKSPFLADKLNDYFLGGIDDMATWTQITWDKVLYMIENGVDKCKLTKNVLYVNCKNEKLQNSNQNDFSETNKNLTEVYLKNLYKYVRDVLNLDESYFKLETTSTGLILNPSEKFQELFELSKLSTKKVLDESANSINKVVESSNILKPNSTYYVLNEYARLGWSLESSDLDNDLADDLLIGSPVYSELNSYQSGAVFVMLSGNRTSLPLNDINLETEANLIIKPPNGVKNSRFGHSVLVLDLNQDGFNDIVVSAPSYDLQNINYEGRVYIYFGDKKSVYDTLNVEITCKKFTYCNIGWSLSKGDLNNDGYDDLIIGSPYASTCESQCGFVGVLFSSKKNFAKKIDASHLDWILNGSMAYEWFGHSTKAKFGYLVVGAPESRICHLKSCNISDNDKQSVGRVYLFKYPSSNPVFKFTGTTEFEQFGYNFDMSEQPENIIIAISSITKYTKLNRDLDALTLNHSGIVQLFNLSNSQTPIATLKSDRAYSGFGSKVKFIRLNSSDFDYLFIASPMRSESIFAIEQVQQGLVYIFKGGLDLPMGNYTDNCPIDYVTPCPDKKAYLRLETMENKSRFGSDLVLLRTFKQSSNQLAISSIHAEKSNSSLSGKVYIFNIFN